MIPEGRNNPGVGSGMPRYPGSFLMAVREALDALHWKAKAWRGTAVQCVDAQGREQVVGLENFFRRLRKEERASWPQQIADYLRSVPFEQLEPPQLNEVADRVLLRLGPPFSPQGEAKDVWYHPLVGKLLGVTLVIDYPNSMSYVSTPMIEESGRPAAAWIAQAVENLKTKTPPQSLRIIHEESGLYHSEIGDAYDSSRAFLLDWLLPGREENGFFVALPGRDHFLVLPVEHRALDALPWLKAVVVKTHQNVPYPISDELFWCRSGEWFVFPMSISGDKLRVEPPPEFQEVLERLVPGQMPAESDDPDETDEMPN